MACAASAPISPPRSTSCTPPPSCSPSRVRTASSPWNSPRPAPLKIPAGTQQGHRVRIGIAIEPPDTSAFFNDLHRLVIGRGNTVSTTYSSPEVAARSRLRLPEGYTATPTTRSPNEIDYEIAVPADAI